MPSITPPAAIVVVPDPLIVPPDQVAAFVGGPLALVKNGDLIEITGALEAPPTFDGFDYREFLFRRGIDSQTDYPNISFKSSGHGSPIRAASADERVAAS